MFAETTHCKNVDLLSARQTQIHLNCDAIQSIFLPTLLDFSFKLIYLNRLRKIVAVNLI